MKKYPGCGAFRSGILLSRIQAVFTGFQFTDHGSDTVLNPVDDRRPRIAVQELGCPHSNARSHKRTVRLAPETLKLPYIFGFKTLSWLCNLAALLLNLSRTLLRVGGFMAKVERIREVVTGSVDLDYMKRKLKRSGSWSPWNGGG